MSPFKIQHSNDVHQFLDDISDCWFVFFFHIASRIDRKPILFFFADCMTLIGSTPMVCQKHLHFFDIWRLQIGVHHTFLLKFVVIYLLTNAINPSKWDHFNLKLFKFLGELTECKLRCSIQFKTFFIRNWIILLRFSPIFVLNLKFHSLIVIQLSIELLI